MSTTSSPLFVAVVFCLVLFCDKTVGKHKEEKEEEEEREEEEEEAGNGGHFDLFHPSGTKTNWTRMNGGRKKGGIGWEGKEGMGWEGRERIGWEG